MRATEATQLLKQDPRRRNAVQSRVITRDLDKDRRYEVNISQLIPRVTLNSN